MSNDDLANLSPQEVYARLTPEQRAALAQQFTQGLKASDHPVAQQLAQVDPQTATPEQVAQMHEHVREHHKGLLQLVMDHPIATAALGAFAVYEVEKHINQK
jgi:CO dehydrogenase/acetyl-CoA synthase beta subunit